MAAPAAGLALARQGKGEVAHAGGAGAGDLHGVEHGVGFHHAAAAGVEQAFGALPHQHQVDAGGARVGQRHRQARPGADGAHPGVQVEREADVQLRDHLGAVGAAYVGQAHRTK